MPRFYFHRFEDVSCLDDQGIELPDTEAAVDRAREDAIATMAERLRKTRKITLSHHIDVEDDDGSPVATVRFADVIEVSD